MKKITVYIKVMLLRAIISVVELSNVFGAGVRELRLTWIICCTTVAMPKDQLHTVLVTVLDVRYIYVFIY